MRKTKIREDVLRSTSAPMSVMYRPIFSGYKARSDLMEVEYGALFGPVVYWHYHWCD